MSSSGIVIELRLCYQPPSHHSPLLCRPCCAGRPSVACSARRVDFLERLRAALHRLLRLRPTMPSLTEPTHTMSTRCIVTGNRTQNLSMFPGMSTFLEWTVVFRAKRHSNRLRLFSQSEARRLWKPARLQNSMIT